MADVRVFATDGFRYVAFVPPIEKDSAATIPNPVMSLRDLKHEWEPTGQGVLKSTGKIVDQCWMVEAFGSNENFMRHAEIVAEHLGGTILNPHYFG